MFAALRQSLKTENSWASLQANILAGLTVGIIALPLSMALAIASGVAPQHGLYTAMVAGIVTALAGGSKVNISGPTAAFVVVLLPIVQLYGLGGLLLSGLMAGVILILLGLARLGKYIEIVPYPVIIGFTSGIAVVIATFQVKDFLGLDIAAFSGDYFDKLWLLVSALPTLDWQELFIGSLTLTVLITWARLRTRVPAHLVAIAVGALTAWLLSILSADFSVATIGSRFEYEIKGLTGQGIPPLLPAFEWPWNLANAEGQPIGLSFELIRLLLSSAITIAILGALESLLCATVADGMSGKKHNPNDELIGQGIGNLVTPLFGGIPATAAIARTAANIKAGGSSPVSGVVHGLFILVAIFSLSPLLAYIPMASMAALLLMVAWNMSETRHFLRIVKIAPRDDVITLLTCFLLTVIFDMTIAVAVGMGLAGMLFIRKSISLTDSAKVEDDKSVAGTLPREIAIYDINGPLFFGSAHKAMMSISSITPEVRVVILDMSEVSMIDMSAIVAMESIVASLSAKHIGLVISNLHPRMITKLQRAGIKSASGALVFSATMAASLQQARTLLNDGPGPSV
ncbi:MAG: C4-dicarboxylic acid transporter DauA [Gammaproteobacteria bacterium]